jgi:hypothetical protein
MRTMVGLFFVASLIALPIGLFQLAKARRWAMFTGWVAFVIGYPLLIVAIWQMQDRELGLILLAITLALGWVPWVASGFMVCGIANKK